MTLYAALGAVEQGLVYGIMVIGVYLTFRILDFPDLTVEDIRACLAFAADWDRKVAAAGSE